MVESLYSNIFTIQSYDQAAVGKWHHKHRIVGSHSWLNLKILSFAKIMREITTSFMARKPLQTAKKWWV